MENDTARPESAAPFEAVTVANAVVLSPLVIDDGDSDTETVTPSNVHVTVPVAPPLVAVSVTVLAAVDVVDLTVVEYWPEVFVVPLAAANDTPDVDVENDTARFASTAPLESFTVAVTVEESPRTDDDGETAAPTETVRTVSDALTLERSLTAVTVAVPAACDAATVRVDRKVPSDCVTPLAEEKDTPVDDDSVTAWPTTAAPAALFTVTTTDEVPPATTDDGVSTTDIVWPDTAIAGVDVVITMAGTAIADAPSIARRGMLDGDTVGV